MEKSKLVICDLDGTLFDTRRVNYMAYREAIERAGLPVIFDYDIYVEKCWGPTYRGFLPIMGVPENRFEEIHDAKKLYYEENLKYATENTHLFNIIKAMKNELRYFGRLELFDVIFTIDDVKNGKPDPEGFLKAMEYFKVKPENTIIFEDSDVGLAAARKTGASICVVDDFK